MTKSDAYIDRDTPELPNMPPSVDPDLALKYTAVAARQNRLNFSMCPADGTLHWTTLATADRTYSHVGHELKEDGSIKRVFIDFRAAALEEALELFRAAVPVKWWGAGAKPIDYVHAATECVDILHFLTSEMIRLSVPFGLEKGAEVTHSQLSVVGESIALRLREAALRPVQPVKAAVTTLITSFGNANIFDLFARLGDVIASLNITPAQLAEIYMVKAALNAFRTDCFNAHASDKNVPQYRKTWNDDREDSEHLMAYVLAYKDENSIVPTESQCLNFLRNAWVQQCSPMATLGDDRWMQTL